MLERMNFLILPIEGLAQVCLFLCAHVLLVDHLQSLFPLVRTRLLDFLGHSQRPLLPFQKLQPLSILVLHLPMDLLSLLDGPVLAGLYLAGEELHLGRFLPRTFQRGLHRVDVGVKGDLVRRQPGEHMIQHSSVVQHFLCLFGHFLQVFFMTCHFFERSCPLLLLDSFCLLPSFQNFLFLCQLFFFLVPQDLQFIESPRIQVYFSFHIVKLARNICKR
mmetsp:Transcript_14743/g.19328  ORF Transcript_14743/g.19328 Transcript_14743/m.19328 type:complete len:218 (-) Transcript_14743:373-1026(-)